MFSIFIVEPPRSNASREFTLYDTNVSRRFGLTRLTQPLSRQLQTHLKVEQGLSCSLHVKHTQMELPQQDLNRRHVDGGVVFASIKQAETKSAATIWSGIRLDLNPAH
ncbi:MAG: hypothetical protein R3C30_09430 [Hyphomonadaceae bacterium]